MSWLAALSNAHVSHYTPSEDVSSKNFEHIPAADYSFSYEDEPVHQEVIVIPPSPGVVNSSADILSLQGTVTKHGETVSKFALSNSIYENQLNQMRKENDDL